MKQNTPQSTKPDEIHLRRTVFGRRHICTVLLLLLTGVLLSYQARVPYEVRLGEEGDHSYIEGFYEPESSPYDVYRWSGAKGIIRFPGVGCPEAITLRIRMNGTRPEGAPLSRVVLKVNGQKLSEFMAEGEMKIYEFDVPGKMVGWSGDMELQIDSLTFSPVAGDLRELGIIVDWVTITASGDGIVIPSPLPLASLAIAGAILCLPFKGKNVPTMSILPAAIGVALTAGLLFAYHRIEAARWSWELLLLVGIGYLGFIALDGILALRGVLTGIRRPTIAILLLTLTVQLSLLAPQFDEGPNVWTYKNWMWYTNTVGLENLYLQPWTLAQPVYPPVSLYILHLTGWAYQGLASPIPPPSEEPGPSLSLLIRLPGIICNVLLASAIYLWVRERQSSRGANLAMLLFALNPAIVLHSTRWGQTDSIHSLLVVLSIICATRGKPGLSWMLISLGVAVKPQALLFIPAVLVLTWQESGGKGLLMSALAAASTTAIVMSPFVHSGIWKKMIEYFADSSKYSAYHTQTVHNAHNLWWLLGLGKSFTAGNSAWNLFLPITGPLSYDVIGFALLGGAFLLALWRLVNSRKGGELWAIVAYVAFAFFMLPTRMHANYMYTVFPMLAMALFVSKPFVAIYLALSGTWLLNLVLHDPVVVDLLAPGSPGTVTGMAVAGSRLFNAVLNTVILSYWTILLVRMKGADEAKSASTCVSSVRRNGAES